MARLYRCGVAAALLVYFVALAWKPLDGLSGFWAYAAVGREVAEHGVPRQTLFLWTARIPWVYHPWLSDLAFYGLTRLPAFAYLTAALTVAFAAAPYAGALALWARRARDSWWVAVPVALVLQGVAVRFEPRPELFSGVFLFLLMLFLTFWRETARPRPAWMFAVVAGFALWANLHGGVALGLVLLAATAVCDLVQDGGSRKAGWLVLLAALAPLAVCANPYGLDYWRAFEPVGSSAFGIYLEWKPVYEGPPLPRASQVAAVTAGALAVVAWAFSPRRRWAELAWVLLFGALFVMQRRNIWPYTVVCLTVAALNARAIDTQAWWDRLFAGPARPVPSSRGTARLAVLAFLGVMLSFALPAGGRARTSITPADFDTGVVAFLRRHRDDLHGRVFNDQEISGYLEWCFPDGPPLYIDRMDAFPPEVMRRYLVILNTAPESKALMHDVDAVIFAVGGPNPLVGLAAKNLDRSSNWARVYAGPDAVVWVRRSKHAELIAACPDVSQVDFAALGGARQSP